MKKINYSTDIKKQINELPNITGVYIFYDNTNKPIYIGKANNLRKRVASYTKKDTGTKEKEILIRAIRIEKIIAKSELEALLLEDNLIKKFKPKYNINLRDDKSYPYFALIYDTEFPRIEVTRKLNIPNAKYYGPFTAGSIRKTLDIIRNLFKLATCKNPEKGFMGGTECLYLHIDRCLGPCRGYVKKNEYFEAVKSVQLLLEKRYSKVFSILEKMMSEASKNQKYEKAARIRDQIKAIKEINESQEVVSKNIESADFIGCFSEQNKIIVQILSVREKKLTESKKFILDGLFVDEDNILSFIFQYYSSGVPVPSEICIPFNLNGENTVESALSKIIKRKIEINYPVRGVRKKLVDMANENAKYNLNSEIDRRTKAESLNMEILKDIQEKLGLEKFPEIINCFDVSNINATNSVGSMVLFKKGVPDKNGYRRFKIIGDVKDDVHMIEEIIERRFLNSDGNKKINAEIPNLIIVDGGMAQTMVAKRVIRKINLDKHVDVIGIAKKNEDIYVPGISKPFRFGDGSQSKYLLQRIRNEAHRFAINYHKNLRQKQMIKSILGEFDGIGEKRRSQIMKRFSSIEEIANADIEELKRIGIPKSVSSKLKKSLRYYA